MRRALLPWGPGRQFATSGSGLLVQGRGCVTDSELYETTGDASGACTIYDGTSANGQVLRDYTLSEGQSTSEQWYFHTLPFEEGLYVANVSGSLAGSVTVWVDHDCRWWVVAPHLAAELEAAEVLAQMKVQ